MEEVRTLMLQNGQGKKMEFQLRPYRMGDEAGMIACIREEYGETYFKQNLYHPQYIKAEAAQGVITFLVAETKVGEIAGMMMLKQFYPKETMCEMATQIFRKKYRGFGLASPFFEYGMEILLSRTYSAVFCLPVLFHDVTQRLLYRQGLRAAGLILNVFDVEGITHSYNNGRNKKHSQGIQIRAVKKWNTGKLYLPLEHWDFCTKVYKNLGVDYHFVETEVRSLAQQSHISFKNEERQHSLEIYIHSVGADLEEKITEIYAQYPLRGKQIANIFLNCNNKGAVWAYQVLRKMGHFFTGLKPLCSEREYMVMHHPGEVEIYFEDYQLSEEFAQLASYIQKCYRQKDRTR